MFDAKYKLSYHIVKKIGEKSFDVQDPAGKIKRVTAKHIQFMYPVEYFLTAIPQKELFGRTLKYINHPNLMLDLYKDLEETNKKQRDHSNKQNDSGHSNDPTHNYNVHSRTGCQF